MSVERQRTLAALLAVALWSTNAWTAGSVLARTGVAWLLLLEAGSATITLGLAVVVRRVARPPSPPHAPGSSPVTDIVRPAAVALALVGLGGTMSLQYVAYDTAPLLAANALTYVWPFGTAAWFGLRGRSSVAALRGVCAAIALAGTVLILAGSGEVAPGSHPTLGLCCALGSACCMGGFTALSDRGTSRRRAPAVGTTALLLATGTLAVVAGWCVAITGGPVPAAGTWAVAAFMGAVQMAAGYWLWGLAMGGGGAPRLAGLGYVTPLLSTLVLLGAGESASSVCVVGVALVLAASCGLLWLAGRTAAREGPSACSPATDG